MWCIQALYEWSYVSCDDYAQSYHLLRQLRQIRRSVPTATLQMLVVRLVLSRLDFGNSVLVGPRPLSRTGRLAWIHLMLERSESVICWTESLNNLSNLLSEGWSTDGPHRKRWRTLGALNEDLNRVKASWQLMVFSLSTALARSSHRASHAVSCCATKQRCA